MREMASNGGNTERPGKFGVNPGDIKANLDDIVISMSDFSDRVVNYD
tara:strand:+ start:1233 stop:1373 length:141 start_codon:yes stop_codon:yes gene_type:complete